jgi:hypothetical protein
MATKKTAAKKESTKKAPAKAKPGVKKASAKAAPAAAKAERKSPVKIDANAVKAAFASIGGPASISTIAEKLNVSTATAKKHLKALGAAVRSEGTTRDRKYALAS